MSNANAIGETTLGSIWIAALVLAQPAGSSATGLILISHGIDSSELSRAAAGDIRF
jgi:hypothetical protein